jgi:hypothetical protein
VQAAAKVPNQAKSAAPQSLTEKAAKTTFFAAENEADVRKKRRRRLFANLTRYANCDTPAHALPGSLL